MVRTLSPEPLDRAAEPRRVLLDVGDTRLRDALAACLTHAGLRVEAARGRGALRRIDARWPDAVVSDLGVSEIDPLGVLLAGADRGVPVLVCARAGEAALLEPRLLRACGVHEVVILPAPLGAIAARVDEMIAARPRLDARAAGAERPRLDLEAPVAELAQ